MQRRAPVLVVEPWAECALGGTIVATGGVSIASASSTVWPLANLAIFYPFALEDPFVLHQFFLANGTTVGGNLDIGVYAADGTLVTKSGSTAQTGGSVTQTLTAHKPVTLWPGEFYLAMALDIAAGTPTVLRGTFGQGAITGSFCGMAEQTDAFPLPVQATLATFATANYLPLCGFTGRSTL